MSCLHAVSAEDKGDILDVETGIAVQSTPGSGQLERELRPCLSSPISQKSIGDGRGKRDGRGTFTPGKPTHE